MRRHVLVLGSSLAFAVAVACQSSDDQSALFGSTSGNASGSSGTGGSSSGNPGTGTFGDTDASVDLDGSTPVGTIVISPANPVLTVDKNGTITPTQFTATVNGIAVPVAWSVERGEMGTIGLNDGRFTPRGSIGGTTRVIAAAGNRTATTNVTVQVTWAQNGGTSTGGTSDAGSDAGDAGTGNGAGGAGGVGGEGVGGTVDATTRGVLDGTPLADVGAQLLYPYAGTVWPRGLLAPLLQWQPGTHAYDAVRIKITQQNFSYTGYFAKTATAFVHHPVPQDVWDAFTRSNGGDDVTVELRFASGGVAYGPLTQTWKIASSELKGIVYYNSYGTKLVQNYGGARGGGRFGAATLGINPGATDPTLVAGDDRDTEGCRVCHSVAANGSALMTQRRLGDEHKYSAYDLKTRTETTLSPEGQGIYAWPAIYPDGTMFVSDSSSLAGSSSAPSTLYTLPLGVSPQTPTPIPTRGLPNNFRAACPSFAPDGKALAFNYYGGTPAADAGAPDGGALPSGDGRSLAMMQFDTANNAFGGVRVLYTPPVRGGAGREGVGVVWPSFLPTSNGIVFEVNIRGNGRDWGATRSECDNTGACNDIGTRSELWWLDTATSTPHVLANLNGAGYLPTGPNAHDDDATLNYEPTVNPVTSGGYAWVVFTSRRLYGNVATINPYHSDPRYADLHTDVTPKKLWVAAIDLNAPPGTDPSHPAFYLPGQELLAGNSRGYWVVDPCRSEGSGCDTGDQCCGGYCRPSGGGTGALVCTSQVPTCAQEFERCAGDSDCCGTSLKCVANRCSNLTGPR